MNKRELLINSKTKRKIGRGPPWRRANYFFSKEIDPSIQHLQDRDLDKSLETCIKNYIVVRLVSILEDFFKGSVSLFVDRNNLPVSILFKGEVKIAMGVFNEMQTNKRTHSVTNGRIIANHFNFANIKEINWVFTELLEYNEKFKELNIDFLRAIKKIDWYDPLRIYKGSWSMAKNWNNFEKMFDIRNDIIHHMKDAKLSTQQIVSLSDNTLNVMDAAGAITLGDMDEIARRIKSTKTIRDEIRERHRQYRKKIPG